MISLAVWSVAAGIAMVDPPALELRSLAKVVQLPEGYLGYRDWDGIGTYSLKSSGQLMTVKLYYCDSDTVAKKQAKREGYGRRVSPNVLSIHAIYREGTGQWKYKLLERCGRTGFAKVAHANPEAIEIQVQAKICVNVADDEDFRISEENTKQKSAPVTLRLAMEDGIPALRSGKRRVPLIMPVPPPEK